MRWTLKAKPEEVEIAALARDLQVAPLIAQLLLQRGIRNFEEAKHFFRPQLSHLHDPFLMKDMDKAVSRIQKAISQGEHILVYGDYDVDGTTAVALVYSYLRETYDQVATYIPDRYKEGYGVSYAGIDFAHDNDVSLIIALDCGAKAVDQVAYAKEKGIDFIICDHHRPGAILPEATAVLDPKRTDCTYPYKELCGCGVGFKLIQALALERGTNIEELTSYLDLVAVAIGADIVPITGENRVLAFYGLQCINSTPRAGFKAMIQQAKKELLTITDVVFLLAPRINAAGRMRHAQYAVTLLVERDWESALAQVEDINQFNTERRTMDQEITEEALAQIKTLQEEDRCSTVVYAPHWHKGVIGIVASRLMETYYRPTLVLTKSGDKLAGSARSVKGFDVYNALEACADLLEQFGGHTYAAGFTLKEEQYAAFKKHFDAEVAATISPRLLVPEIQVDARLQLHQINPRLLRILKQFAPFGPGNRTPIFLSNDLQDTGYAKTVGEGGKHLKCTLMTSNRSNTFQGRPQVALDAIGFRLGDKLSKIQGRTSLDAVFSLEENTWNGQTKLQLKLRDIK